MRGGWLLCAMVGATAAAGVIAVASPAFTQSKDASKIYTADMAFEQVASVLNSPRCQNCHTLTNFPRQGNDRHRHLFNVMRGPDDRGAAGLPCSTCHGKANNVASGVPGADEDWRLAPMAMGWEGLSSGQLCRQLKDTGHNGNRNSQQIFDHLKTHLVAWAWSPGSDAHGVARTTPPISYEEFLKAAETWMLSGASCS